MNNNDYNQQQKSFYLGNPLVKRDGVREEWTLEKIQEYKRCSEDPVYFIEKYMKIITLDEGLVPFRLWDFQKNLIDHINEHRFSIILAARQCAKSTTMVAYMLWYSLFNADQTVVLLSNKGENSRQLFGRFILALENVPFFLQPGTKVLNKGSVEFANNTKVYARATSSTSIRGMSCVTGDTKIYIKKADEDAVYRINIEDAHLYGSDCRVWTHEGFKRFERLLDRGIPEILVDVVFTDGSSITCTEDHRFLICKENEFFKEARFLTEQDQVVSILNSRRIIREVKKYQNIENKRVYDLLNVEDTHAYFTNSVVSHNCNLIALDEFAFVERAEEFFTSSYPVISSGKKSRVIIVSTPNGQNLFYKLWTGAVTGTNEFKPFTIHWSDVPGRDEEFKQVTQKNIGDKAWEQEYELNFQGSGNTLIDGNKLLSLSAQKPIYTLDDNTIRVYREPIKDHSYIMTVDVSRGRGQDYSTFNVIDVTASPFEQVCVFQDNMISPLIFPNKIEKYAKLYNEAFVVIESNDNGVLVCNSLFYDLEYDNQFTEIRAGRTVVGAEMTRKVKSVGCSNLKDLIEEYKLILHDKETIQEVCSFVANGRSYEAEVGTHDDLVMNLVMFAWFSSNESFRAITDIDIKERLYEERIRAMEEELLPFGVIDDGRFESLVPETFGGMAWQRI